MPRGIQPRRSAQRCLVVSAYHFTCAAARSAQASNLQVLGKLMTPRPRCFLGDKRRLISILWLFRCTNSWNTFGSSHHNKNSVGTCSWRAWALGKTSPMKESFLIRTKVAKETNFGSKIYPYHGKETCLQERHGKGGNVSRKMWHLPTTRRLSSAECAPTAGDHPAVCGWQWKFVAGAGKLRGWLRLQRWQPGFFEIGNGVLGGFQK